MPRAPAADYSPAMEFPVSLSGQLLLAMPGIGDPRFERAVIAMCVHDEQGALGIGLGRVMPRLGFRDLLLQLDIDPREAPNAPIHQGGPVEPQRGFILHSPDWRRTESIAVGGRWVLSATLDILKAIAAGEGPSRWVAALGYAGWGPGQIEEEMNRPGWFVTPGDDELLYACDVTVRWSDAFRAAGIDTRLLTATSGTA